MSTTSNGNGRKLSVVASKRVDASPPVSTLTPLDDDLPASRKVYLADGELQVPAREISVTGGNPPVRVYDTTGPQGHDVLKGLPRLRAPWIARREARGDTNFSQMHYAR